MGYYDKLFVNTTDTTRLAYQLRHHPIRAYIITDYGFPRKGLTFHEHGKRRALCVINNMVVHTISTRVVKVWKVGWNRSNSRVTKPCLKHGQLIKSGFEVCVNRRDAKRGSTSYNSHVLTVLCHGQHLIAANDNMAMFSKVFVYPSRLTKGINYNSLIEDMIDNPTKYPKWQRFCTKNELHKWFTQLHDEKELANRKRHKRQKLRRLYMQTPDSKKEKQ